MFLTSKVAWSGLAFILILLTTGLSGPRSTPLAAETNAREVIRTIGQEDDVKKVQQALADQGHYRGKVDGTFGLRTRASVREYQKAENFPITGHVDVWTAARLGVRPESTWGNSQSSGRQVGHQDKPSAGIRRADSRSSRTRRKEVSPGRSAIADNRVNR
jgi:peptidoglycan hydrolase-like protein with peptidoglycan-binding domain